MAVRKCKGSSHVDVRAIKANGNADGKGVWFVNRLDHGSCKNDKTYNGTLYVLTRLGKPGMQLFPELAMALPDRLLDAASVDGFVRITHRVLRIPVTYATLTAEAARDLAAALITAVAG